MTSWLLKVPADERPNAKRYRVETKLKPVLRQYLGADVADVLVRAISETTWLGRAAQIRG